MQVTRFLDGLCPGGGGGFLSMGMVMTMGGLGWAIPLDVRANVPEGCTEVSRRITEEARIAHGISSWDRLAAYLPADGIPPLFQALAAPETAFEAAFALGASRQAAVLAEFRDMPPAAEPVAGALALLALGDASQTATVAEVLYRGSVVERRRVARALSYMDQARPRLLLYESLDDRDARVRLSAAHVHTRLGSRHARRVLRELFESGPPPVRAEAARALFSVGTKFDPEAFPRLPADLRGAAMARYAFDASRSSFRNLRGQLGARDRALRAGLVAAVVARDEMTHRQLARWVRRAGPGPARMARVLAGDSWARDALDRLTALQIPRALEVVAALRGLPGPAARLDRDVGLAVARRVAPWLSETRVPDRLQAWVLEALGQSEPDAGRFVARARLLGDGGRGLVAAAEVLSDVGTADDVVRLLGRAVRVESGSDRACLLAAAARICAR